MLLRISSSKSTRFFTIHNTGYERLVLKETVESHRWESKMLKFNIKNVDEGQISNVKR